MKAKTILSILLLSAATGTSFAQSDWFSKFSAHRDITQVTLTKDLLQMLPSTTSNLKIGAMKGVITEDILKKIKQIDIFTSDDEKAGRMMQKEITDFVKRDKTYAILMQIRDNSGNVYFYGKRDSANLIESLVMLVHNESESVVIRLQGKFTPEDLRQITGKK
jgi:hypothetical protein